MTENEKGANASISKIDDNLIVALTGEMTDADLAAITEQVAERAYRGNVKGAVLDFSMITVMDTYTFSVFRNISSALSLMGVRTMWAGLRPGVVFALMDLNIEIDADNISTAINLEQALDMLKTGTDSVQKMNAYKQGI